MKEKPKDALESWRRKIDQIDVELVKLLNERAHYAREIGKIKTVLGIEAYSPEREEEIMGNVTSANPGPLSLQALRRVFERIIDESRSVERGAMNDHKDGSSKS